MHLMSSDKGSNRWIDDACILVEESASDGFVVGLIVEVSLVPGKDKLSKLLVDIGLASGSIQICSNAPHLEPGQHVVVVTIGATVNLDGEEVKVSKAVVGGVTSSGMLANSSMLGWKGGDQKQAVRLDPIEFPVGSKPPSSRPRKA